MKTTMKYPNKNIELAIWQLFTIFIAAVASLIAIGPLVSYYRTTKCDTTNIDNVLKSPSLNSESLEDFHRRYIQNVDQCDDIPPLCADTTTTTRSTVSTVLVTRPTLVTLSTTQRTTTADPWVNRTRPYNSWRLPTFAKPIDYTLRIACLDCFTLVSSNSSAITFNGQVTIHINISNTTDYLVLHAKNLNIIEAKLINSTLSPANITYLSDFELIYLSFAPGVIPIGELSLIIDYTGYINQQDQTGFYRELFWKSMGEISYVLAANFQPIHARQAFPCFDEPNMQATFTLSLEHPQNSTVVLSNSIKAFVENSTTTFEKTPLISTYSLAWAILPADEFQPVTQTFGNTTVIVRIRSELLGESNRNLKQTFNIIEKTFQFIQNYLNISSEEFPTKLDFIGVPDLILDEKASSSWGLLTFREEFLATDESLNSAERLQTTTKLLVEHILQIWFSKVDWWENLWFVKSLSSYLAYKMIEIYYPSFRLMEQFSIREITPLMIDDFKPSAWIISNRNLTNNQQILDASSINIFSKSTSLLRLVEYLIGNETFQSAVQSILSVNDLFDSLNTFYLNCDTILNTTVTVKEFLQSWILQRNYPLVTIEFLPKNDTYQNTTISFTQKHYSGLFDSDDNSIWMIYMECDLGGMVDEDNYNLTTNHAESRIKFLFSSSTYTMNLGEEDYLWIKCNKDFYSYQVTEYIHKSSYKNQLYVYLKNLFKEDLLSNNDRANLLNDVFILPYGRNNDTYDQTVDFVRLIFYETGENLLPWSVFIWHWNYLLELEEHSKYFWNFKQFTTIEILLPISYNIDTILSVGDDHEEKLLKSMLFDLLCRIQNPNALNKATELYRLIPANYFSDSGNITNVNANYLSTVIYYHIQNANHIDEWDYLWNNFTENPYMTSQQRNTFLRALAAAKEIWRLKSLLEIASDTKSRIIKTQEFFDLITSISQNSNGRDILWNYYRQNYQSFLDRFGQTNRLFNQLIVNIVQSFENSFYYQQLNSFLNQYLTLSQYQQIALEQIDMNVKWLNDGKAKALDNAIAGGEKH